MPIICEVNSITFDYTIEIIPSNEEYSLNFADLLKNTISTSNDVQNKYNSCIKKYKKIFGQERIQIIESLDKLFLYLVLISNFIQSKFNEKKIFSIEYKILIKPNQNKFFSSGKLEKEILEKIKKINDFYEKEILPGIKNNLIIYKKILNDKNEIQNHLKNLLINIDNLLYNILLLRYNIKNCLIDS